MRTITFTPEGAWIDDGRWPWRTTNIRSLFPLPDGVEVRVTDVMYDRDILSPAERQAVWTTAALQAAHGRAA